MDVSTIANLINALAVTAGVIFAAVQIRDYRRQQHRDSMSALVRSFQTPSFAHSLRRVSSLPDNVARDQIPALLGPDGEDHVYALLTSWEALGILLYRKEVTIELVDDFFSGPIVVSWRKLSPVHSGTAKRCSTRHLFRMGSMARGTNDGTREADPACSGAHRDWNKK
jgi:hypothetical protein